ncbi:MAG TPA: hypothetical protein VK731_09485 [Candidatus Cybelea sp.]|jgi:hypothetical protein|nr:hypothetical protein [Candidatus Cybelea sp.]
MTPETAIAETVPTFPKPLTGEEIAREAMASPSQRRLTELQEHLSNLPQVPCPLDHEFTNQFYVRTIHVPAGTLVISKIFKADFPFFISKGRVSVWIEGEGVVRRQAPYWGFTKAGTRRIIMHHTDVDWSTVHFTSAKSPDGAEAEIIFDPGEKHPEIDASIINELKDETL